MNLINTLGVKKLYIASFDNSNEVIFEEPMSYSDETIFLK